MLTFAYLIEPPFNHQSETGTVTGCDVELARTVLAMAGHADVEFVEFVEAEFAELVPGLAAGRWRMTTGLFATEDRRRMAAFSRPIWALPDGLLVPKGNPLGLSGYVSVARHRLGTLAVVRDQVQHRTAVSFGMPPGRLLVCDTYRDAADAVLDGRAAAYASVARAHVSFIAQVGDLPLEVLTVGSDEKAPAFGCFGFALSDDALLLAVDAALASYLGSAEHRAMMRRFGFSAAEIDAVLVPDAIMGRG